MKLLQIYFSKRFEHETVVKSWKMDVISNSDERPHIYSIIWKDESEPPLLCFQPS